ncbi:MAG TPA: hypothetical protein GX511_03880 [Firmicutes bacterium]|nr:hypothetical protein [Bacillota bacterium]
MPRYGLFLLVALLSLSLVLAGCTAPAETPAVPPPSAGAAAPESPAGPAEHRRPRDPGRTHYTWAAQSDRPVGQDAISLGAQVR